MEKKFSKAYEVAIVIGVFVAGAVAIVFAASASNGMECEGLTLTLSACYR